MTRNEVEQLTYQTQALLSIGFTPAEAEALRRISMTLHRWAEHECNGAIQRDGENGDGRPFWYNTNTGTRCGPVPDREAGALKRLKAIIGQRNERSAEPVLFYVQGDPRGCALYLVRPGDVPSGGDVSSYYNRGIAIA